MKHLLILLLGIFLLASCKNQRSLPDYGHAVIPGVYTNQLGQEVDSNTLAGKVLVVDFVFTHCPSICPKMAVQMHRVQEEFGNRDDLQLVSFSIDPQNDTVERMKWYTDKIGANHKKWWFVRAEKEVIDQTADSFKVFQEADDTAPGGFNHQSRFILLDKEGTVRGYYNGVDPEDVDRLLKEMKLLF